MSALILKMIAEITMFGDHFAASMWDTAGMAWPRGIYWAVRSFARIAFPIFGFQLSEGVRYTSNKWKYLLRLCIFALISEPFFDRALFGSWFDPYYQNVYFTLICGFFVMILVKKGGETEGWKKYLWFALALPAAYLLGDFAEYTLHTDYGMAGVLMLTVFSVNVLPLPKIRESVSRELVFRVILFCLAAAVLVRFTNPHERYAFLGAIPVACYSGLQGKMTKKVRVLFYSFYPLHLAILSVAMMILQ